MAQQGPNLQKAQQENVVKDRDAFLHSTRGHKKVFEEAKYQEQRDTNRRTRIAVVQALIGRIDRSDAEEDARRTAKMQRAKPAGVPLSSVED